MLSSWEAASLLRRNCEAARGEASHPSVPDQQRQARQARLARATRALASLTFDVDPDVRPSALRADVERAAEGRLTAEELAAVLSLRPATAKEAVLYVPSLRDFDNRPTSPASASADPTLDHIVKIANR